VAGSPFNPVGGTPDSSYGRPGSGGRAPVTWRGPIPPHDPNFTGRRPVVAVLDTGCGKHRWFDGVVTRNCVFEGLPLGLHDPGDNPEVTGLLDDPLEGELDSDAGHGTFIAGLIRQACAEADILAIRVMASDGAVVEHVLIEALTLLALRQRAAQNSGDPSGIVDIVSLSLGYYHEQAGDAALYDQPLLVPLTELARLGVAVVVAAGNDATTRPNYPAAFYPHAGGEIAHLDQAAVPVISVGARNPDGTIALFSNAGPWVTCHRAGANVVSTLPPFNGGEQAPISIESAEGIRAAIDPDNYAGGFGTWSGTSFAAPLLAGEMAQALVTGSCGPLDQIDPAASVTRGWAAVTRTTKVATP
jgi:subtilisin family serine protease